jgi:predicted O-linked N-acetylglucosamine transferase (SPINDLY family)
MGKKQKKGMESRSKKSRDTKELFETAYGHHMKGNTALAEDLYLRIIRMEPRHSNALNLLGTICLERGEHDKALDLIMKAVKAYPMGAMFHNNLGNVFRKMGLSKDAEKAYREALRVDPACVAANNNLGTVLYEQGDMAKAIDHYETACRNDAGFSPAYYNLGRVFCEQGRIDTAIWAYRQALKIDPDFHEASSNLLYTLHFSDALTPGLIFEAHREWAKTFAERYYPKDPVYENMRDIGKKLRIGYVSPDFKAHSVAFFLEDVIVAHNRERVEVFCYSCSDKKDEYTFRFQEISDAWRDISALSDEEACRMIRDDRIDILVDLAGHTRNSRILVFAWKPAPVQVTWLGYPDTTGLETMGYRITDLVADPPGEADALASEKLVRLPGGFHCYRPSGESFPIKPLPCLATGAVTFGSFNNNAKISESVISAWSRILKGAPGSRLKLKSRSFADFGTRKHILERFGHYGIPSERIWFEGYKVSLKEHFLLYNTVDIALDTFPYNGTTTTCEALFMGVPVITLKGDAHVSRVGASLLHHSGLDGFIASTVDEYVEKAVALSNNVEMLSSLRKVLRDKIGSSTLMNPGSFAEKLENA